MDSPRGASLQKVTSLPPAEKFLAVTAEKVRPIVLKKPTLRSAQTNVVEIAKSRHIVKRVPVTLPTWGMVWEEQGFASLVLTTWVSFPLVRGKSVIKTMTTFRLLS